MKRFQELTEDKRKLAEDKALGSLLEDVVTGTIRFNDVVNKDDLQARIDLGLARASSMGTPWFAAEYVLEYAREDLMSIARPMAEDSLYPELGEALILGVA